MRQVEVTIEINTSADQVIKAFTELEHLAGWWQVQNCFIETKPGGLYTLVWNVTEAGFGYISTGLVARYDPQSTLHLHKMLYLNPERQPLGPMSLQIEATALSDNKSSVYLCQSGYQNGGDWDWYYETVREVWPKMAQVLKNYLEKNQEKKYEE